LPLVSLDEQQIERIVGQVPGGVGNVQDIYPLTPLQEGILFHHMLDEHSDAYVLPSLLELQSQETLERFLSALQGVVDRHDILRSAVVWKDLQHPVQVVYRRAQLQVEELALDGARDAIGQLKER